MSSVSSASSTSLLIPPNPSLSKDKPSASILLNGTGRPVLSPRRTSTPLPPAGAGTSGNNDGVQASLSPPPRSPSISSTTSTTPPLSESSTTSSTQPQQPFSTQFVPPSHPPIPIRRGSSASSSSTKIHFAPLPSVPPDFRRRNSITLGVASRKHLIGNQGSGGSSGGTQKVVMNDEEWESYKKMYENKNGNDPVDVGQLAKSGAKALWRTVKRARSSSTTSNTSSTSASVSDVGSTSEQGGLGRRSSAPPNMPQPINVTTGSPAKGLGLGTVEEEDGGHEAVLAPIPGSPPPRLSPDGSLNSPTTSISTLSSAVSDTDGDDSPNADNQPHHVQDYSPWSPTKSHHQLPSQTSHAHAHAHGPGQGLHAGHLNHLNLDSTTTTVEGRSSLDGDATPRRRPSPPPRVEDKLPSREEVIDDDEEDADGRRTPIDWDNRSDLPRERERDRRTAVLGFDQERFGMLSLGETNGHTHAPTGHGHQER
ncbi:hypothetical protein CI109_104805 [Kwoniella shandongensis]|uniref:Uncharacterized protein n=1 Tax=Kwoniella shandongensis TaxID=1734106 RepID=A0A5M6BRQ6_9TREE|nr:uncharacterized protein CI109_006889 [Kwoniella shandongensis]KAA5524801.1 hypothetical protein CI109_006889 [Kwoniella shandongensis]